MDIQYDLDKLISTYIKYGNIVVGVDFDDTLLSSDSDDKYSVNRCSEVVELVNLIEEYSTLCLWTVANDQSTMYKIFIAREVFNIKFDYINDSPLKWDGNPDKKHFNILLDDKAGLNYTMEVLRGFLKQVKLL